MNPLSAGDRIGRYELLEELGSGGMGVVFRARDREMDREVALKSPHPELVADPKLRHRFLREARLTSRLSHPHIVPILDSFEHEGRPWIALQLISGKSLAETLRAGGKLPPRRVAGWAESLTDALRVSHERGVLHRDVNPRNVLVADDGRVFLTDFGLARLLEPEPVSPDATTEPGDTTRGAVMGTPRYMSPEQALGKPLDERSDLFSLGAVLYEMLTGAPAFGPTPSGSVLDAIIHREPEPIARFTYETPAELERIVRKAMAKDPDERYPDARSLLVDLRTLRRQLDAEEFTGSHPEWQPRAVPPKSRRRTLSRAAWIAGTAAAAIAVAAGWLWLRGRETPLPQGRPIQITSSPGWEGHPALSPDGGRVAYCALASGNYDLWIVDARGGEPLRLTDHPADDRYPAWFPDGSAIAFVSERSGSAAIWKIGQMGGSATLLVPDADCPAISPDGSRIAFARKSDNGLSRICVAPLDALDAAVFRTGDDGGLWNHRHPAWSPDGRRIAYASQDNVWVFDVSGKKPWRLTSGGLYDSHPAWAPSGRWIYFGSNRGGAPGIWRVAASGGDPERVTTGGHEAWPSTCAAGRRFAYGATSANEDVVVRDIARGTEATIASALDDHMPSLAPDGSSVVYVSKRQGAKYEIWRQRLSEGVPRGDPVRLTDQPGDASHPAFSPDGRWVAYYRVIEGNRDIWVVPAEGGEASRVTEDPAPDYQPSWWADGSAVAFVSERAGHEGVWLVPVSDGRPSGAARRLTPPETRVSAFALSPDGRRIAFADAGNHYDLVLMDLGGGDAGRVLLSGQRVMRMRWDRSTGGLLVSGWWGEDELSIRRVSSQTGETLERIARLGGSQVVPVFDVSVDGRFVAFSRSEERGDVWVLEAEKGSY